MYKVMLADDEGIVIESLQFVIEKYFPGECQIETAKTGRKVIELAEQFRPDIAVMDIQMPGINGIDAMKEIRESNQNIVFIVMSAYDKFDYAKEAIKLGVLEYIMKPMNQEKIVDALKKAMDVVSKEREKRSNDLMIKEKLETVSPIIESGLVYNILFREHFSEDIENYKTILDISSDNAYMIAVVCGDEQQGNHMTNAVGSSVKIQNRFQEIRGYLKEYFPNCIVGSVMANKIAVLIPYNDIKMEYNARIELIDKARELARNLRKRTDISFRIGIGRVKSLNNQAESYTEALNALVDTTGSVAHADDLPIGCDYESNYPIDMERKLFEAVEKGEVSTAVSSAQMFFDWMKDTSSGNIMSIKLKVLEFVLWSEHIAYNKGGMTYRFNSREDYLPKVMDAVDVSVLKEWFVQKIAESTQNITSKRSEKSNSLIETAVNYIEENYSKNITLDYVSRIVNISPYYFSKLFKEETGEGFVEYLTRIRMDKAKELLSESTYSMKEICSMVGYADPNYFSRTFRKNVGVSPTEYKGNVN